MFDHDDSTDWWCNCQAIPGTENFPGPWHPVADQPWYPCAQVVEAVEHGDSSVH